MTKIITTTNSKPVVILEATCRNHILIIGRHNGEGQPNQSTAKGPCMSTRAISNAPMSETIVEINSTARGKQLVSTHSHLIHKWQALVAQGIVDTAPAVLFNTECVKKT